VPSDLTIVPFKRKHLSGVMELFAQERWSYADDEQRTWRALTAPGSVTLIALLDEAVVGVAQVLGDGEIQAFLAVLLVAEAYRHTGVAKRLVAEALARTHCLRLDVISCADGFYERLGFKRVSGFRVTPGPAIDRR
jgi:GNAT superfamily N-acetyltransferase